MGDKINLTLDLRTQRGKKVWRLRKQGFVPGVVYGHGFEPIMVQSPYGAIDKAVREAGRHTPVHVVVDGKKRITLIKEIDRDPLRANLRHVAFHAVKANERVDAIVPIRLVGQGESEAEKAGLIVLQAIEEVEVRAKPADLPEVLEISVEGLKTDQDKILLSDIELPSGVEYTDVEQDLDLVIANVYEPAALEAANEAAAGDADGDVDKVESGQDSEGVDAGATEADAKTESEPGK